MKTPPFPSVEVTASQQRKEITTLIPPPHCNCYLKTTGYVIKRASHKFFLDNVIIFALKIDG